MIAEDTRQAILETSGILALHRDSDSLDIYDAARRAGQALFYAPPGVIALVYAEAYKHLQSIGHEETICYVIETCFFEGYMEAHYEWQAFEKKRSRLRAMDSQLVARNRSRRREEPDRDSNGGGRGRNRDIGFREAEIPF